ncbi:MAG: drug/metabolite exporter YedA [Acidobacteriaceae bacterium]
MVNSVPPIRAAALRFAIAALVLTAYIALRQLPTPTVRELRHLAILAVTMMALPYGLLFWAERRIPSSTTAVLFSSLPLATALLTPLVTHTTVPRRALLGMLFATAGILVIFSGALSAGLNVLLGAAAVMIAVISGSWSLLFAKRTLTHVHPAVSTAAQLGLGALALFAFALVFERDEPVHWTRPATLAMTFLIVFGSIIAFSLYYWLLRQVPAYQIASIQLVVPIVAIIEGAFIGKERIPLTILGAAACILASVAVVLTADEHEETVLSITTTN